MKYIIMLVIVASLLPGIGGNINLGIFYMSFFRIALIFLAAGYFLKYLNKRELKYVTHGKNKFSILFMIFWFLYSILTIFWVKDISSWIHGEYFIGVALFVTIAFDMAELKTRDFQDIFVAIQAAMGVHNVLGWYEILTHNYLFALPERIASMRSANRYFPISMMLNQNDFMLVLLLGFGVSVFFVFSCKSYWGKGINFLLAISNLFLCISTDSRAGILGLLVFIFVVALFLLPKKGWLYGVIAVLFLLSCSLLVFPQIYLDILEKMLQIKISSPSNPLVDSDAVRLNLIRNGFIFIKETFGFGVGTGNVEYWMEAEPVYFVRGFLNMHNWWMEILTAFGILVFLLYIVFYIQLILSFLTRYKRAEEKKEKLFCVLFVAFMAAFIPASISSSSNWGKEWLWVWWALLIAYQGMDTERNIYL